MMFAQCLVCSATAVFVDDLGPGDFLCCFLCNNTNITKFKITNDRPSKQDTSTDDYNRAMKGV